MDIVRSVKLYKSGIYDRDLDSKIDINSIAEMESNVNNVSHSDSANIQQISWRMYSILYILNLYDQNNSFNHINSILRVKPNDKEIITAFLDNLQLDFPKEVLTKLHPFLIFKDKIVSETKDVDNVDNVEPIDNNFYYDDFIKKQIDELEIVRTKLDFKYKMNAQLLRLMEQTTDSTELDKIHILHLKLWEEN
jgi:hypothetical protein